MYSDVFQRHVDDFDSDLAEKVETVADSVKVGEYDASDSGLYYEFGTLHTWRGRDVERTAVARVVATCHLGDRVRFGVENVWEGDAIGVLTDIGKSRRRTVVAVGDYHVVLHEQCAHLAALTVGVLAPYLSHPQVAFVEKSLLIVHSNTLLEFV